jgi:hypothetical protein
VLTTLQILTKDHDSPETYAQYIQRVSFDPWATAVKLFDLEDNIKRSIKEGRDKNASLLKRYFKAVAVLAGEPTIHDEYHFPTVLDNAARAIEEMQR